MDPRRTFVRFVVDVLRLDLTPAWEVLLAVAVDRVQPRDLEGEQRELARRLFGDVEEVDPRLRRVLVWRLGRASGKTTLAAALLLFAAWTVDLSGSGRGQVPAGFVVSPTRPVAKICQTIARELVRGTELEPFVQSDTATGFILRRPDGRLVEIVSVAASKGGANLRGRDVVVLVLDESEFFASNSEGTADGYAINDRDQISAVMPRLLGFVLCISTPWPTENVTAEYFDANHGRPTTAVAALGPSMLMRPSAQLAEDIEREAARDPENAAREYECKAGGRGGSRLFDAGSVDACLVEGRPLLMLATPGAAIGCGGDLAMERDSSAIAVVSNVGGVFELLEFDEVRPTKDAPLVPFHVVVERFVPVMQRHGSRSITMDAHYRQSAIEHLTPRGLRFLDAPTGAEGKYAVHMKLRAAVHGGRLRLPVVPRIAAQLKAVTATALPGGGTRVSSPRRAGQGHGDIVSALALAVWECHDFASHVPGAPGTRPTTIRTRFALGAASGAFQSFDFVSPPREAPAPRLDQPTHALVPGAPGAQPSTVPIPAPPSFGGPVVGGGGRGGGRGWTSGGFGF